MSCGTRARTSARAILMALGSSVLPSVINCLLLVLLVACVSATLRQPAPLPVLRLLWLGTPLPNLPVRASAADAFTEVLLTTSLLGTAHCAYGYCHCVNCGTALGGP
ncbi:hypothetical protein ACFWBC_28875 [Streptomyces sp. NPDC059985]|uniref:hypothetical protein n=1 Tax=Streptomyces sp. NPDC059985 TaxID=3347025 RepID=UPI0036CE952D